jgi:hypothetical protein
LISVMNDAAAIDADDPLADLAMFQRPASEVVAQGERNTGQRDGYRRHRQALAWRRRVDDVSGMLFSLTHLSNSEIFK